MNFLESHTLLCGFLHLTGAENSPVQSSREIRIASAIFPTLSLLNHSCCPNTSLVFSSGITVDPSDFSESVAEDRGTARGVTVTVRAAKGIAAGQDILHCYGKKMIMTICMNQNHFDLRIVGALENCQVRYRF